MSKPAGSVCAHCTTSIKLTNSFKEAAGSTLTATERAAATAALAALVAPNGAASCTITHVRRAGGLSRVHCRVHSGWKGAGGAVTEGGECRPVQRECLMQPGRC